MKIFQNYIFIISLAVTLTACNYINNSRQIHIKGKITDKVTGEPIKNTSFTVFSVGKPTVSNTFISEVKQVAVSSTDENGDFSSSFEASWKFTIEFNDSKDEFCHSLDLESRYFDVSSFIEDSISSIDLIRCSREPE